MSGCGWYDPEDDREDVAYEIRRQEEVDAEADRRRAAEVSLETLALHEAQAEGARAGSQGLSVNLNPYESGPLYDAWLRGWYAASSVRAARLVA